MGRFIRNLMNVLRPFKRIRNEISAVRSEIAKMREEICVNVGFDVRNILAYQVLRDSKESLMSFYPHFSNGINVTNDFVTMKRYLDAVRPVLVKNLVRVGGENDGGYIIYGSTHLKRILSNQK